MDAGSLSMWLMAAVLGVIAFRRNQHREGLKIAWSYVVNMFPRMIMAILLSGFFSATVPPEIVADWLGKESGIPGIFFASLLGGITPGGPLICFPMVVVLYNAGAAIPPLIAFLTGWSLFSFHRVITYEIPIMGARFAVVRILSSLLFPPLAGILAALFGPSFL